MGSFKGHVLPGTLFLLVGVWHIWSATRRYVSDPKSFRVRAWNPVPSGGRVKYLELYVVAIGAFIDMCIELFYSTHLKFFVNGVLNPSHMNDFEHGGMLLMFFLFGAVGLLSEKSRVLSLPEGALPLIAATAFGAEYLLFSFHSTTHKGLEGYYHLILVILIGMCIVSVLAGALNPESFAVDLCSGVSFALQGIWFYQTAFTLYGPMMPCGCKLVGNDIKCRDPESEIRGELWANFQLFTAVLFVFVAVVGSYAFAAAKYGHSELESHLSAVGESPVHR
ncbi:hypothetical protein H6P81_005755 [Aristolochia fimbriata]|uniref:Transmembrane protein 45B n=1 Tax=Aristolochia fimbriata TaxID=158543 RepID=A0AAV7EZ29_ARIFI|nr:hypothetical protein H6P81_005755 [Aristolochia fimbriata]